MKLFGKFGSDESEIKRREAVEALVTEMLKKGEEEANPAASEPYLKKIGELSTEDECYFGKIIAFWKERVSAGTINDVALPNDIPQSGKNHDFVVLGHQLLPDGSIKPELEGRLERTYLCAQKYPEACFVLSGGPTADDNDKVTEASAMADYLLARGVAKERLLVDPDAMSTVENILYAYKLIEKAAPDTKTASIISSGYHVDRGSTLLYAYLLYMNAVCGKNLITVKDSVAFYKEGVSIRRYDDPARIPRELRKLFNS